MADETFSPDGRTRLEWGISTGRMSHEIRAPRITDAQSGEMILDLWIDDGWDASEEWLEGGILRLRIRHYHEGGSTILYADIDRAAGMFYVDGGSAEPIDGIQERVAGAFWRKAKGHTS